jgi:hypothetical protein
MADYYAKAIVPTEGVFPLPLKGEPLHLTPNTKLNIVQTVTRRKFKSSGSVLVVVECVK